MLNSMKKAALCFFIPLVLLSIGAIGTEITKIDVRFAVMLQDMAQHGIGIFPTINGVEYCDYPSGWFCVSWLATFGGRLVTLWLMSLPAILCCSWTMAAVCLIGERVRRNSGVLAAAFLLVTPEFLNFFFGFGIDAPAMAAGATLLLLFHAKTPRALSLTAFVLLLVACFFIRGVMGLVVFGAAIGGCLIGGREWKNVFIYGLAGAATTAACAAAWFLAVRRQGGEELWNWCLECQFYARIQDENNYLSYFTEGFFSLVPVTALSLGVLLMPQGKFLKPPVANWIGFSLLPMLILSIPSAKHLRYMAVALPGFALMAGYAWNGGIPDRFLKRWLPFALKLLSKIALPAFLSAIIVLCVLGCFLTQPGLLPWGHFACAAALMLLAAFAMRGKSAAFRPALFGGVFFCVALNPFLASLENSEHFVSTVEAAHPPTVWLYEMGPDHDDLKYVLAVAPEERGRIRLLFKEEKPLSGLYAKMYRCETLADAISDIGETDVLILRDREKELESLRAEAARRGKAVRIAFSGTLGHRDVVAAKLAADPEDADGSNRAPSPQESGF